MPRINALKVYEGPSQINPTVTIMVIITGLAKGSANSKTGDMLQTWILVKGVKPNEATKTGQDAAVCGQCPLRPFLAAQRDRERMPRPCYVKTFQAPRSTWVANKDKPVASPATVRDAIAGRKVRRGSYGDPAAVPLWVWHMLDDRASTARDTGYTHQWATYSELATRVMASVHTVDEMRRAQDNGFRTFRVMGPTDAPVQGEILCPASKEAGARTTCERCGLCNGKPTADDRRKSIAIYAH
jgi:hypothetical protein